MRVKLVVGILTYNRKALLDETLRSLFEYNKFEYMKIVLVDNGSDSEYRTHNKECAELYGAEYIFNNIIVTDNANKNIEKGHLRMYSEILKYDSELFFILEDDWKCIGTLPIEDMEKMLTRETTVGQIRVRDFRYDDSFYGGSSKNFVTMKKICFDEGTQINKSFFKCADMHWVNSCSVMTREAIQYMENEMDDEVEKMNYFHKRYPKNAQLEPGVFYHIGPQRVREDLRAKGLFLSENISQN